MLCRGVDFGVLPRISEAEVLAEYELLQRQASQFTPVNKASVERSRCELAAVALKFSQAKPNVKCFSLQREHRQVLKDLRRNKNLVITRPDKGKATVILQKDDYVQKMLSILNDSTKFLCLGPSSQCDHTLKTEYFLQSHLKKLLDSKEISEDVYNDICPNGSVRPRLYGLPKVHKTGVPLRPILSMSGSPQYRISKWLCEMLKPVVNYYGTRCVQDSFVFSDTVKATKLSQNGYMCSFDVVSLFTNVPLKEVIDICACAIYHDDDIQTQPTSLTEKSFRELLQMVTSGVEFSFDDLMYRQTDGVAMGSPLGPLLANIFVGYYERRIPDNEWPEMYSRFVDDVFSHFESKELSVRFGQRLNGLHPALRFTSEGEHEDSLPFMDVRVTRTSDGLVTSLYRKPTFTGLYMRWDSYSPTEYKVNLVRTLTHRARRICSSSTLDAELRTLRSIFLRNGYPGHVLDKYVTPIIPVPDPFIGPKRCRVIIQLPWIGPQTQQLVKETNDAVRIAYFAVHVRAVYRTARAFPLPKDKLPTPSLSQIVYLYECRHCMSQYVGRTSKQLEERIKQHVPRHLVNLADTDVSQPRKRGRPPKKRDKPSDYQSAIACHLAENKACRQKYSDDSFTVLSRARTKSHLNVLEAMYIHLLKPVLCIQKSFVSTLSLFKEPV